MNKELFRNIPSSVDHLLNDVRNGRIGLPDLQRPFVWTDSKVRNLLDSMIKGYPIGYIMLWKSPENYNAMNHIGANEKAFERPADLVIDGQQRLTALLAAIYGIAVKDKKYRTRNIKISYNPLSSEFAVWTQPKEQDAEWISAISDIFEADQKHIISKFRRSYIKNVNEKRRKNGKESLSDEEEDLIEERINGILDLLKFPLPTLEISASANEEDVADIFVRVNSGGQNLTEKNFIETLLSVYDSEVHDTINKFCADSWIPADGTSYNPILKLDPSHIIRAVVGVGFSRARLRYAYMLLRGKNLKTGEFSVEEQNENLKLFKKALQRVTDLTNWHDFINLVLSAGYLKDTIVSSSNAIVFSYVLYLIGKYKYKVPVIILHYIIKEWIFMAMVTGFYTGSTESEVEKQFADLRSIRSSEEFVQYLQQVIDTRFTDDYFTYTLPENLNSSSANSPTWFGYIAALNILGTPMLFSTTPLSKYFSIGINGNKNIIDKHHIFPKNYLDKIGYKYDRDKNQIANFTYVDYATNINISDKAPQEYVTEYREKLGEEKYNLTCQQNALPKNFEHLEYMDFLKQRRILMAQIIKKAYLELKKNM